MMENKGCITCRKCEQVRSNFFCGRTRLSQKQLYNKHGFCSDYEPKEQNEKQMTEQEYIQTCTTEQLARFISAVLDYGFGIDYAPTNPMGNNVDTEKDIVEWLKQPHKPIS